MRVGFDGRRVRWEFKDSFPVDKIKWYFDSIAHWLENSSLLKSIWLVKFYKNIYLCIKCFQKLTIQKTVSDLKKIHYSGENGQHIYEQDTFTCSKNRKSKRELIILSLSLPSLSPSFQKERAISFFRRKKSTLKAHHQWGLSNLEGKKKKLQILSEDFRITLSGVWQPAFLVGIYLIAWLRRLFVFDFATSMFVHGARTEPHANEFGEQFKVKLRIYLILLKRRKKKKHSIRFMVLYFMCFSSSTYKASSTQRHMKSAQLQQIKLEFNSYSPNCSEVPIRTTPAISFEFAFSASGKSGFRCQSTRANNMIEKFCWLAREPFK